MKVLANMAVKTPLSTRVSQAIRQRIKAGEYLPGKKLPSLRILSREFSVSQNVIYRAFQELESDKLLVVQHGRGAWIRPDTPCLNDAVFYAAILPFSSGINVVSQVVSYAERTFSQQENLMFLRFSEDSAADERAIAKKLLYNGALGLLLWPAGKNNSNGEFFNQIAQKIPVVVVAEQIDGCTQPSVTMDFDSMGKDVIDYMFKQRNRKRLLVIADNPDNYNYRNFINGLQTQARNISKFEDLTIVTMPVMNLIRKIDVADYSDIEMFYNNIKKHLTLGEYDALFCQQEEILESVVIETGLNKELPDLVMGSITGPMLTRSRKYYEAGVARWFWNFPKMISVAVEELQKRTASDSDKPFNIKIPMHRLNKIRPDV